MSITSYRDLREGELKKWTDAFGDLLDAYPSGARQVLERLGDLAGQAGVAVRSGPVTPYVNTIPAAEQPPYPGDLALERRIRNLVRWNAMAMVVRANRDYPGIGGHISTYASAATLLEVGFHHFFRAAHDRGGAGDEVYFQGHASPGIYARAYLEGRLEASQLLRFRREVSGPGLSSYPHPWLMPALWTRPTVSMGLSPLMAIYHARFLRYVHALGLCDTSASRVWCFLGDGECDEPEALAGLALAGRERLDNLVFVVNCNLQRLDGPVRGNGKIIQELEGTFRGAGWNVIKLIWGSRWDPLLAADDSGALADRMGETLDGEYQKYSVERGAYIREHFFGGSAELSELAASLSDRELQRLDRGGHDPRKVYAAYQRAVSTRGAPSVVLAKTLKGFGLGDAGAGHNVTHQQKKLDDDQLEAFRARFDIPLSDEEARAAHLCRPADESAERRYLRERRMALGGWLPARRERRGPVAPPASNVFEELRTGTGTREVATTMAFVRLLNRLMSDDAFGARAVPIVPDEARTFGMDALFRKHGIYASGGQHYEPVDRQTLLYYREAGDGRILEEGITEAGAMASFIAAGTAHVHPGISLVPFFLFYSMFGFQRIGDLIWAAADARAHGFLLGATAGRTTLAGEGLQHQDGHSQLLATAVPTVSAYDPAFAYELGVIVEDRLGRMLRGEPELCYITLYNETYPMPPAPSGQREHIARGLYCLARGESATDLDDAQRPQLIASGPIVREALRAQRWLADHAGVAADVWSATSWQQLRRDAVEAERFNRLHPAAPARRSWLEQCFADARGPFVCASDWVRMVPEQIARWLPGDVSILGTDGFGRSDTRPVLRRHFEIDAEHIAYAALHALGAQRGDGGGDELIRALRAFEIDPDRPDPWRV